MSEKIKFSIGTVFVSSHNFEAIIKLKNSGKYKNFSNVIDDVIQNWLTTHDQNTKFIAKIQELYKENRNLTQIVANYRGQIVETGPSKGV